MQPNLYSTHQYQPILFRPYTEHPQKMLTKRPLCHLWLAGGAFPACAYMHPASKPESFLAKLKLHISHKI